MYIDDINDRILGIEKIPENKREFVKEILISFLRFGRIGSIPMYKLKIDQVFSEGKTDSIVFAGSFESNNLEGYRVIKITDEQSFQSEMKGYKIIALTSHDLFATLEPIKEEDLISLDGGKKKYGILLYQAITGNNIANETLSSFSKYIYNKVLKEIVDTTSLYDYSDKIGRLLIRNIFLTLEKYLYKNIEIKTGKANDFYGKKLESKEEEIIQSIHQLKSISNNLPEYNNVIKFLNRNHTYYSAEYIHGDLNTENILLWYEEGQIKSKIIDFGEIQKKKEENFTPLFWDYSRLLGELVINFAEQYSQENNSENLENHELSEKTIDSIWKAFHYFLTCEIKDSYRSDLNIDHKVMFIAHIYFKPLHFYLEEPSHQLPTGKKLDPFLGLNDFFICQITFWIFYSRFKEPTELRKMIALKLAGKLLHFINSDEFKNEIIANALRNNSYFNFDKTRNINTDNKKNPYMGLSFFEEKDFEFYFGREKEAKEFIESIHKYNLLPLVGNSGIGKSSFVYAKVIPKLRKDNWKVETFRPADKPIINFIDSLFKIMNNKKRERQSRYFGKIKTAYQDKPIELLKNLIDHIQKRKNEKNLVFIDQFEEIFTQIQAHGEERDFISIVLAFQDSSVNSKLKIIYSIRSDFLGKLSDYQKSGLIQPPIYKLPFMEVDDLKLAILEPANKMQCEFEPALVDTILKDVGDKQGNLPLLQFCLHKLWETRSLTHTSYVKIGRVSGAIAKYAEDVYESFSEEDKKKVQYVMVQLTKPGEGTGDTKKLATIDEIGKEYEAIIQTIIDKRLLVSREKSLPEHKNQVEENQSIYYIEIIHDALIKEWKKLQEWMDAVRAFRIWQDEVEGDFKIWNARQISENLLKGDHLNTAMSWMERKKSISQEHSKFIIKSWEQAKRDEFAMKFSGQLQNRIKELEYREKEKLKNKWRRIAFITAFTAIFAFGMSWFAINKMKDAMASELKWEAIKLESNYKSKMNYMNSYYEILKGGIKGQALDNKYYITKLNLLSTLNRFVYPLQEPIESGYIYTYPKGNLIERLDLFGNSGRLSFSNDGARLASINTSSVYIWNVDNGNIVNTFKLKGKIDNFASFSPDGKTLAIASDDNRIKILNISSGDEQNAFPFDTALINSMCYSPDGNTLAIASNDNTIKLLNLTNSKIDKILHSNSTGNEWIRFSPDGQYLAIKWDHGNKELLNVANGNKIRFPLICDIEIDCGKEYFVLDGKIQKNDIIKLFDVATGNIIRKLNQMGDYWLRESISISPDGKILVFASDNDIVSYDLANGEKIEKYSNHRTDVISMSFSPDGKTFASADNDTIRIWNTRQNVRFADPSKSFPDRNSKMNSYGLSYSYSFLQVALSHGLSLPSDNSYLLSLVSKSLNKETGAVTYKKKIIELFNEEIAVLLPLACEDLTPQMNHWMSLDNPPYPKEEMEEVMDNCKKISKK